MYQMFEPKKFKLVWAMHTPDTPTHTHTHIHTLHTHTLHILIQTSTNMLTLKYIINQARAGQ